MQVDNLQVKLLPTRQALGAEAARDIHEKILSLLSQKEEINMIFAAAPSQNETLEALLGYDDIAWERINAFHMDEYIGLAAADMDKSFGAYLSAHIFSKAPFKSVNLIHCTEKDLQAECRRYAQLLATHKIDIVVMGIGENGHIAFNDPPVADFQDPEVIKAVKLDEVCRQQQVNDGCFASIDCVPTHALTLTCPTLFSADHLFCVVPAATKADAVYHTLNDHIGEACPATILRRHSSAVLYLDAQSSGKLNV